MKNNLIKFVIVACVILSFSLKASAPMAPDFTTIKITDIPAYYDVKIWVDGWDMSYTSQTETVYVTKPITSTENFILSHGMVYDGDNNYETLVKVYYKQYSWSSWTYVSYATNYHHWPILTVGNDLMQIMEFDWDDLYIP